MDAEGAGLRGGPRCQLMGLVMQTTSSGLVTRSAGQWVLRAARAWLVLLVWAVCALAFVLVPSEARGEDVPTPVASSAPTTFTDTPAGMWYMQEGWIQYAAKNGLMTGYKDAGGRYTGEFGPEGLITRGEVATVLYRIANPTAKDTTDPAHWIEGSKVKFPDLPQGKYFYNAAVKWCADKGIVTGYKNGPAAGTFGPENPVTREELATMVYRFARVMGASTVISGSQAFDGCGDTALVQPYARDAMKWCAARGILTGLRNIAPKPMLQPQGNATRAQAAKVFSVLHRDVLGGGSVAPAAKYTVAFNSNGGSAVKSQAVESGKRAARPANPTRAGYTFKGWYADEALKKAYDFDSAVRGDLTLYARWEKKAPTKYTVTFNSNGGSSVSRQAVSSGGKATKPADPTRAGYAFRGWYSDKALTKAYDFGSAVKGTLTLYARWEKNAPTKYTVTFNSNGGSSVKSQTVESGKRAAKPADPTRAGYAFKGWYADKALTRTYDFSAAVKGNLTLYAKWEKNAPAKYTVTFDADGGFFGDDTSVGKVTQTVESGSVAKRPSDPRKAAFVFVEWCIDYDLTTPYDFDAPVTGDMTLWAKWRPEQLTVTYETNGGSRVEPAIVNSGYPAPNPTPVRDGYTFAGWYDDEALTTPHNFAVAVRRDLTLYAKWERMGQQDESAYAMLYEDGSLVFQRGDEPEAEKVLAKKFEVDEKSEGINMPWRDSISKVTSVSFGDVIRPVSMAHWFDGGKSIESVDLANLDASVCTDFNTMFGGCSSLASLNLTGFDTSSGTDFSWMFFGCSSLKALDLGGMDVSAGTNFSYMFSDCSSLTSLDLDNFTTKVGQRFDCMFSDCSSLTALDLSGLDTSAGTDFSNMFSGCSSLTSLDLNSLDTARGIDFARMFLGCSSLVALDLSGFDTSAGTDFSDMFSGCTSLESLNLSGMDVSAGTDFSWMFYFCSSLTSLDVSSFDTSQGTNFSGMFSGCAKLEELDLSGFNTSNATSTMIDSGMAVMFNFNRSLRRLTLGSKFTFTGNGTTSCELPTPDPAYVPGATGKWYNSAGEAFDPEDVPSSVADTYTAIPPAGAAARAGEALTVTFAVDGRPFATQALEKGAPIADPGMPAKEGFEFAGWAPEFVAGAPCEGDATYEAVWRETPTGGTPAESSAADATQGGGADEGGATSPDSPDMPTDEMPGTPEAPVDRPAADDSAGGDAGSPNVVPAPSGPGDDGPGQGEEGAASGDGLPADSCASEEEGSDPVEPADPPITDPTVPADSNAEGDDASQDPERVLEQVVPDAVTSEAPADANTSASE